MWKWRHYFDVYHRHLSKFLGSVVHIAEVGVFSGGSMGMWSHYFGPQCKIYGIDIEEACRIYERDNISIFIGDQENRAFWKEFKEKVPLLNIFIDDGGHSCEQQIVTLEEMLPHLRPGGVYICEDIHGIPGQDKRFEAYISGLLHQLNMTYFNPEVDIFAETTVHVPSNAFQKSIYSIHRYPFITVIEKNTTARETSVMHKQGTQWQPFLGAIPGEKAEVSVP